MMECVKNTRWELGCKHNKSDVECMLHAAAAT